MAETTSKAPGEDSDESAKYFAFPKFDEEGSKLEEKTSADYTKIEEIMYRDIKPGEGDGIKEKQKVSLHYNRYNRSAALIESKNFEGSLDELSKNCGPGLTKGIKDMKLHGKRRIIILPSKTGTQGKKPPESSDKPTVSVEKLKNIDTQEKNARERSSEFAVADAGSKNTDTQGKKAEVSSTKKLEVHKAGKEVESESKSADTQVEKGEVSEVELPAVFDVELLGIRRTWNPFG